MSGSGLWGTQRLFRTFGMDWERYPRRISSESGGPCCGGYRRVSLPSLYRGSLRCGATTRSAEPQRRLPNARCRTWDSGPAYRATFPNQCSRSHGDTGESQGRHWVTTSWMVGRLSYSGARYADSWLAWSWCIRAGSLSMKSPLTALERLLLPRGAIPGQRTPRRLHVFSVLFFTPYAFLCGWLVVVAPAESPLLGGWFYLALVCIGVMFATNSGGILLRDRHENWARLLWVLAALTGSAIFPLMGMALGGLWLAVAGAAASVLFVAMEHALHRGLM